MRTMIHDAGMFTYIHPKNIQKWPSHVAFYIPAPWVAYMGYRVTQKLRIGLTALAASPAAGGGTVHKWSWMLFS